MTALSVDEASLATLLPEERLAFTVAASQVARDDNPGINTTAALLLTIERLIGLSAHRMETEVIQRAIGARDEREYIRKLADTVGASYCPGCLSGTHAHALPVHHRELFAVLIPPIPQASADESAAEKEPGDPGRQDRKKEAVTYTVNISGHIEPVTDPAGDAQTAEEIEAELAVELHELLSQPKYGCSSATLYGQVTGQVNLTATVRPTAGSGEAPGTVAGDTSASAEAAGD